jgi:hypothetical protein
VVLGGTERGEFEVDGRLGYLSSNDAGSSQAPEGQERGAASRCLYRVD